MATVLSRNLNDIKQITAYMNECKHMGIRVLGPDVNESMRNFSANKAGDVRFGLAAIKGSGRCRLAVDHRGGASAAASSRTYTTSWSA